MAESSPTPRRPPRSSGGLLPGLLLVVLALHAVALYLPGSAIAASPVGFDKVAHLSLFGIPAALAVLAGGWWRRWVPPLLVAHAAISEVVQGSLIPNRAGDPFDALADVIGILLGWGVVALAARTGRRRPSYEGAGSHG